MAAARRQLAIVLVAGVALGCSATSTPPVGSAGTVTTSGSPPPGLAATATSAAPSPSSPLEPSPGAWRQGLPASARLTGPEIAGAFDLATDGRVLAWSSGTVDIDAPSLWWFDPASADRRLVYRSRTPGAILANLAVRHGAVVFAEVTPRPDGSRTWRLILLDAAGSAHVIDANDLPASQPGVLPMAAISDRGVLWATSHAGDGRAPRCELRHVSLAASHLVVVAAGPCARREIWYPRSDGPRFVYGTVDYPAEGGDERHVFLVEATGLDRPRRLDLDAEASLPAILGDTVVWKAAPRDLNMFSPNVLVELPLMPGSNARALALPPTLTTPSIGTRFVVGEDTAGGSVTAWDRGLRRPVQIDQLGPGDPGYLSGTRLAGDLLAWFYTSSTVGGGTREIRWLRLG
ncbi:MAG TPA: hypothetical protein VET90_06360 [Candidatus Binatus sp.]|nr:hypothetical protein [Candidatus Binatus sp.]